MRIMYLLFSFTIGGTERLVVDICNEMVAQQQDVHLYIINNFYSDKILKTLSEKVHLEFQNRQVGCGEKMHTIRCIARYIKRHCIEVVHCNSFDAPELLILKPLYYRKARIIHTIHDVGQYAQLPKWKIILRNRLCDCFVAISESVHSDLVKYGAKSDKIITVNNAINLDKFQKSKGRKKTNPGPLAIGNVARFMPEKKGQDILIDALIQIKDEYPEIVCYFAGGCNASHERDFTVLKQKIDTSGLKDRVFFLGDVEDIPSFLDGIDIFVLPSRFEGFGISLIEAMSLGIPCIASNLDGPAEIIGNNERGFLFEPGNVAELAERLRYIIENYSQIKKNTYIQFIHDNFDIRKMCKRLIQVYRL